MVTAVESILRAHNLFSHLNDGITVCHVKDAVSGQDLATEILHTIVDTKTALYLSGGSTPKALYQKLAQEEKLIAGAIGQVDERYGKPLHDNSNQKMIDDTGLLRYLQLRNIRFYPLLQYDLSREEIADVYDQTVRSLHATFKRSVAILGIGADGHTAGIVGNRQNFKNSLFEVDRKHLLVSEFNDEKGYFKERVTMTFLGLSMLDLLILLVFGDDKKDALEKMFEDGNETEIPARFYKRPEIAKKTIIITDQVI